MKSGFAAIVGRPSAGKSTLLNSLCGEKVAITSNTPQTTRIPVRGIVNHPEGQIVFLDTPGYHNSEKKFNTYLRNLVQQSLKQADLCLYLIDGSRPPGPEEYTIMEILKKSHKTIIAAINKTDLKPKHLSEIRSNIIARIMPEELINISALKKNHLETLLQAIINRCPEGPNLYPADLYTDQQPAFRISEIIREQAIRIARQELVHTFYIEISDLQFRNPDARRKKLWIRAFIVVERSSQIGIFVGAKGSTISTIRMNSLQELRRIFSWKIELDLRIKANPKWRHNDALLQKMFRNV